MLSIDLHHMASKMGHNNYVYLEGVGAREKYFIFLKNTTNLNIKDSFHLFH